MVQSALYEEIDNLYAETVERRRFLHQHPEVSFHETKTARYISDFYEDLGIPYRNNVGGNGVLATLKGGKPGKTIALRADFDALPIQDEKEVPYKSTVPGVMHACGHDGHTAALLSIAKAAKKFQEDIPGTIVFIHQHAEELVPGGAKPMIDAGTLEDVDAVFGTHLWATEPLGKIQTTPGPFMAGADRFTITVRGKGGHGGYPHETKDALVIGAQVVMELQQIISRKLNPLYTAVITVGQFNAGQAFNIIAETAKITGTVRYLRKSAQEMIITNIKRFLDGAAKMHDVEIDLDYGKGYPPLTNHVEEAHLALDACKHVPGVTNVEVCEPSMAGEDFAYYMKEKPGTYFFTGAAPETIYPHHHPKFDIDERALLIAAKSLIACFFAYQEKHEN
ncbi:amidohydrolase [Aciduricibacillus chroicocephali]|uniref:Amidohydrolase n=1 Tax=Aciduricibacillus chroicocephali TaxID=3054939 RepID=A0ABY9KXJ6_9BACI|nr:amidohydrolase [Bacillaceae bacterium 44XB]